MYFFQLIKAYQILLFNITMQQDKKTGTCLKKMRYRFAFLKNHNPQQCKCKKKTRVAPDTDMAGYPAK